MPGEHIETSSGTYAAPLTFSTPRSAEEADKGEGVLRDWIAEPFEAPEPVPRALQSLDFVSAYLDNTISPKDARFVKTVLRFLQKSFGIGSIVWGIKNHHALLPSAQFNPVEIYLYSDHPTWAAARSPPTALLHALSRFYPDAARWITTLRKHTRLNQPRDAPCDTRCKPGLGHRFVNHMTGLELPVLPSALLNTLELIESCKPLAAEPRCTWINHVNVLHANGKCRHKNIYYHLRQSIEEGWYRDECNKEGSTEWQRGNCASYTPSQMDAKMATLVKQYARYHGWNSSAVPQVMGLLWNSSTTNKAWTLSHKSKLKSSYGHPDRHAIYTYGVRAEDTARFAQAYGFKPGFVRWIEAANAKESLRHILFDVSIDFVVTKAGAVETVGAAIGGGSL